MDGNGAQLLEVPVSNLKPGMYVAELDRPWLDTPFAVQGFYVRDSDDVSLISKHCSYVLVDPRRYQRAAHKTRQKTQRPSRNRTSLKREFAVAKGELESAGDAMRSVFEQLRAGRHLDLKAMQRVLEPLVQSVLRNSEAMAALVRIKAKGDYLFNHSIANAVWAAVLGRQLGLEREPLRQLALGAAVVDVGMTRLEDALVEKPTPLTSAERKAMEAHVPFGLEILRAGGAPGAEVLETLAGHHERFDGSGYPRGLEGYDIPLFARIVGIVDSYDAMITERPHARARSSFEAVQELADLKDVKFQGALVEQFMQAIGLFPTGAIVELNTGEVGVVVAQNRTRRLRPKVVVILDPDKRRHAKLAVVDLARHSVGAGETDLWICRELAHGTYGIEPDEFFL